MQGHGEHHGHSGDRENEGSTWTRAFMWSLQEGMDEAGDKLRVAGLNYFSRLGAWRLFYIVWSLALRWLR